MHKRKDSFNKRRNAESVVQQSSIPMKADAESVAFSPHLAFGSGGSILWHVPVLRRYNDGDGREFVIVIFMSMHTRYRSDVFVLNAVRNVSLFFFCHIQT